MEETPGTEDAIAGFGVSAVPTNLSFWRVVIHSMTESQDQFTSGLHGTVDSKFPKPAALPSTPPPGTGGEGSATKESGRGRRFTASVPPQPGRHLGSGAPPLPWDPTRRPGLGW